MRFGTALKGAAFLAVVLTIALIAAVKSIDFNRYKSLLSAQVKAATGRELTIAGPLELKPSLVPLLVANGVTLSNAAGGSRPVMVKIERVEAEIALLPLLKREFRIQRLVLSTPEILLETDAQGRGNWQFAPTAAAVPTAIQAPTDGSPPTRLSLRELKIKNAHVKWRDGRSGRTDTLNLHKIAFVPEPGPAGLLGVQIIGDYQGDEYSVNGKVGGMAGLGARKPWPVQLRAAFHGNTLSVEGSIADPLAGAGADLKLAVQGDELALLARLAGHPLPPIGPFKLSGRLNETAGRLGLVDFDAALGRKDAALISVKGTVKDVTHLAGIDLLALVESDNLAGLSRLAGTELPSMGPIRLTGNVRGGGTNWALADIRASLAGSDLAGDLALDLKARPRVTAKLQSTQVILTDLTTPAAKPGEKLDPKPLPHPTGDGRLFPAETLPLDALHALDADISLHVAKLVAGPSPLTDLTAEISLKNGRLTAQPLHALLAGGILDGDAVLDASAKTVRLRLAARQIELGRLAKDNGSDLLSGGRADLQLALTGHGTSLRALMASASGELRAIVGEGSLHNRAIDWAGGDVIFQVLGALNPLAKSDNTTQMDCAVAHFQVRDGIATAARGIAVETAKVNVVGAGIIDLRSEELDIGITPTAREGLGASLGSQLAGVTRMRGTLARPAIGIDELGTARAAISVGAAVASGGLSLLGELLFDKVTADATPCRTAIAGRPAKPKGKPTK